VVQLRLLKRNGDISVKRNGVYGGMGVGKIFPRGEIVDFSRGFKSGEMTLYPLETKKTTYFC